MSRCHMALHQVYENEDSPLINHSLKNAASLIGSAGGQVIKTRLTLFSCLHVACHCWSFLMKPLCRRNPLMLFWRSEKDTLMYADWGRYFSPYGGGPASLFMKMSHSVVNKTTLVNRLRLPYSSGPQQRDLHNLHLTEHHRRCTCKHLSHCDSRSLLLIQYKQHLCVLIVVPLVE